MPVAALIFGSGALLLGLLALLMMTAWRALRERWSLLLAGGFTFGAVRLGLFASGYAPHARTTWVMPWTGVCAMAGLVLVTAALFDYLGITGQRARRFNALSIGFATFILAASLTHAIDRGAAQVLGSAYFIGWGILFIRALGREPHSGHGLLVVALATYPASFAALRLDWLPFELQPAAEIMPLVTLGMTALTTGLVRAQRRATRELAARRRAESELRLANETLESRVALRTQELRETIEGLESFNRSVSHDLRGPLGGIAGVAKLARDHVAEGNASAADRMLAAIATQADKSAQLVGALLALARVGDAEPRRTRFDLAPLVQEAIGAVAVTGLSAHVAIEVLALPAVSADRDLLRQVLVNLIGNACKFASAAVPPRVEIGHLATHEGDAFYVRDNGVGFDPESAPRLFMPFQRLHGAAFDGSGVGLSIVRRIVTHHGGRVWAEGSPGAGATFWFTLG